jgi:hypothetical protein
MRRPVAGGSSHRQNDRPIGSLSCCKHRLSPSLHIVRWRGDLVAESAIQGRRQPLLGGP